MAFDILLYHPWTNASVDASGVAMADAVVHRSPSGDSTEAEIEVAPETMPVHVRHNLRLRSDGTPKFFGMITKPVNRNTVDKNLVLNVAGIRKRLYEHPLAESYVPAGDVGAMVRAVLGNAVNIPVGLSWANSGASTVPDFGFLLGDRVTKRAESVGDFLDAMAQAVPGFVVPSAGAEYDQMIEAFPEMSTYSAGDVVLGAVWGVLPDGAIFFSRRDTANSSLVENTNCFIYEQDTIDAENIVTAVRWIIDRVNLQGHAMETGYRTEADNTLQDRLEKIPRQIIAPGSGAIFGKTFNFNQDSANSGAYEGVPISKLFNLGEVVSYDAVNISLRNQYGLAFDTFRLDDIEPAFRLRTIAANWVVVKGEILTGVAADIKTGVDPITVTTNIEGYFVMSLDIADITLYDGFYINAPDAEVAWYLYNIPTSFLGAYHEIPFEYGENFVYGKTQQVNLFSKKALLDAELTNAATATKRLTVTMKFTDRDGIGNYIDVPVQSGVPDIITLVDTVAFSYTLKEYETIRFISALDIDANLTFTPTITQNGITVTFPFVAEPNDVIEFLQTTGVDVRIRLSQTQRRVLEFPDGYIVRGYEDLNGLIGDIATQNSTFTAGLALPHTVGTDKKVYFAFAGLYATSTVIRFYSTPTIERTIYGAYLVEKDTGYLRRLAQNLYKTPAEENMTILCDSFVEPTRRLDISGRGVLYPTRFEDRYIDNDWHTIITVGQPENSDDEAIRKLIDDRAKNKAKELGNG
jgi:hypothetical protein